MAAQLIQMVTVVDKSGKAVNSRKHMVSVWKEAKAAYLERKAEKFGGQPIRDDHHGHQRAIHDRERHHRTYESSHSGSHHRRRSHDEGSRRHHHSRSSSRSSAISPNATSPKSPRKLTQAMHQSAPTSPNLQRSHTPRDNDMQLVRAPPLPPRSYTTPSSPTIDMDMAYGEMPDSVVRAPAQYDFQELDMLVRKAKRLLEEADCLQYSATKTIAMLQKNPDAMATVALTLAEISNIARRVAPGLLSGLRGSSPSVFALLASPQFLIASGVAVGLTVVAFGGFKIIKKIRAKQADEDPGQVEAIEYGGDLSRIHEWRRGIESEDQNNDEVSSDAGTSVDAELITPLAAALMRSQIHDDRHRSSSSRSRHAGRARRHSHSHGSGKRDLIEGTTSLSSSTKTRSPSSSVSSRTSSRLEGKSTHREKKVKKPSPLRLMFQ